MGENLITAIIFAFYVVLFPFICLIVLIYILVCFFQGLNSKEMELNLW